jgi:tRNA(Ile)-lysidine synthase
MEFIKMTTQTGISSAEFAAALKKAGIAETCPKIAVAVSGGGDSLALALLVQEWVNARSGEMLALTVDHGLRSESAEEAAKVQSLLRARGVAHEILLWRGDKPSTRVQELAREARYKLLLQACRDRGFPVLAVAHNLEDQIETFWMRLAHGSGLDGLAAMAPVREEEGVCIIRPSLAFSRARLRATCAQRDIGWIEDPSNKNEKYLRVKLRAFEEVLAGEGLTPERLSLTLQKLEDAREALQVMAAREFSACVTLHPEGYATLNRAEWEKLPRELRRRVLMQALKSVSPHPHAPGFEATELARLELEDVSFAGKTLSGCDIFPKGGDILIAREASAVERHRRIVEGMLWDGRFRLSGFPPGESCDIGAVGEAGLSELRKNIKPPENLPFKVKRVLPALWQGGNLLAVPHLGYYDPSCHEHFRKGRVTFVKIV